MALVKPKKTYVVKTIQQPNGLPQMKVHHVWMDDGTESLVITQIGDKKRLEMIVISLDGLDGLLSTFSELQRYYHPEPFIDNNPDQLTLF